MLFGTKTSFFSPSLILCYLFQLLSVSGPLQAWGPVVDGVSVQGKPSMALMNAGFHRADLLLGSSAEDGLISRAKRIKVRTGDPIIQRRSLCFYGENIHL